MTSLDTVDAALNTNAVENPDPAVPTFARLGLPQQLVTATPDELGRRGGDDVGVRLVSVRLTVEGRGTATDLAAWLADVDEESE